MTDELAAQPPTLLFLVGPPAVGKMTVGQEIAAKTGLRVFHNHQSIDLALQFFEFGSPPFGRLANKLRRCVIVEVAASDLPGLIFNAPRASPQSRPSETWRHRSATCST